MSRFPPSSDLAPCPLSPFRRATSFFWNTQGGCPLMKLHTPFFRGKNFFQKVFLDACKRSFEGVRPVGERCSVCAVFLHASASAFFFHSSFLTSLILTLGDAGCLPFTRRTAPPFPQLPHQGPCKIDALDFSTLAGRALFWGPLLLSFKRADKSLREHRPSMLSPPQSPLRESSFREPFSESSHKVHLR